MRRPRGSSRNEELPPLVHELRVLQLELERQNEEIRRAQRELEAERDRVADLYQLAPVAHLTLDRTGTIVEVTLLAIALLGVDRGRLTHRRLHELVVPADWALFSGHLADVFAGGARRTCDLRMLAAGDTVRMVRLSSVAVPEAGGPSTRCRTALLDITERRQVEEGLRDTRAQFEGIVLSALDAIVTVSGEGRVVLMNPAAERMFGCEAATVIGHEFDRFIREPSRAWYRAALSAGADRDVRSPATGRLGAMVARRADGTEVPVEASISEVAGSGGPLFTVILRDVSVRQRAERALADRLRLEQLVSRLVMAFGHLSSDEFDGEVQSGLRAVVDFLGVERGGLIEFSRDGTVARSWSSDDWLDVTDFPWMVAHLRRGGSLTVSGITDFPDDAVRDRQSYLAYGVRPQAAMPLEVGGKGVGALVFSAIAAERATPDDIQQYLRLLGEVFANLLSREQAELELQKLRWDLAHVNRVATVGELTTSLAHELSQPLAAILNNAQVAEQLMEAEPPDLEQVREILRDIVEDDRRAGAVIHRLRNLLKKGTPEFTALDVNEVVGEVARLIRSDASVRGIAIRLDLDPGLPPVRGDRVQLQQVLINLAVNGLDAMQAVWTGERALVFRTTRDDSEGVRVAVRDSGVGIGGQTVDRMVEPFYTTKADGMGMGLAIAQSIVETHGARLAAVKNPEGGTTFSFTLPAGGDGP